MAILAVGYEVLLRQCAREHPEASLPDKAPRDADRRLAEHTGGQQRAGRGTSPPSVDEHYAAGRALRQSTPRSSQAAFDPGEARGDPIEILEAQATTRVPQLVPFRYGRMAASPFAFLRGSAAVMAADLGSSPRSGIEVEACGDCHLSNFGIFATPERNLVFDLNDFDETLPAPFEWDVKRLAASIVVAARTAGLSRKDSTGAARSCVESYRTKMRGYAGMGYLDIWYARIDVASLEAVMAVSDRARRRLEGDREGACPNEPRLARAIRREGRRHIPDQGRSPLIQHVDVPDLDRVVESASRRSRHRCPTSAGGFSTAMCSPTSP